MGLLRKYVGFYSCDFNLYLSLQFDEAEIISIIGTEMVQGYRNTRDTRGNEC